MGGCLVLKMATILFLLKYNAKGKEAVVYNKNLFEQKN